MRVTCDLSTAPVTPGGQTSVGEVNRAGLAGRTELQSSVIQPHLFSQDSSVGVSTLCLTLCSAGIWAGPGICCALWVSTATVVEAVQLSLLPLHLILKRP